MGWTGAAFDVQRIWSASDGRVWRVTVTRGEEKGGLVTIRAGRNLPQTPCRWVRVAAELDDSELQRLLEAASSTGESNLL
jgi:hypothetical protein